MCRQCPASVRRQASAWFSHCMLLHSLVGAGCHFGPDDLTLEEWLGLAELKAAIQQDAAEAAADERPRGGGALPLAIGPGG